jgi:hypothetical protein
MRIIYAALLGFMAITAWSSDAPNYDELREAFTAPDHAISGEVPL